MSKILRYLFIGVLVFVFLYYFGDIRINDLNIRDYLQKTVTLQNLIIVKKKCGKIYYAIESITKSKSSKTKVIQPKVSKVPDLTRLADKKTTPSKAGKLDALTYKDREKLRNLLQQHLDNPPNAQIQHSGR